MITVFRAQRLLRSLLLVASLLGSHAWAGTTYTYQWVQTGCQGDVCAAAITGAWTFQPYAVERGGAIYFGLRNEYPQLDQDGVISFSFTIGEFIASTIKFGPITWDNSAYAASQLGSSYHVQFSDDRQSIVRVYETAFSGAVTNPNGTGFERARTNPSIGLTVEASSIRYHQATGSEPFGPDGIPVRPSATLQGQWRLGLVTGLVGDKDDFTPGQSADLPPRSAHVQDLLTAITRERRQSVAADLDAVCVNRPAGWTHEFYIPPGARIAGARASLRLRANGRSGNDDYILYDESSAQHRNRIAPFIALRDLLPLSGRALQAGEVITVTLDLASVPVHIYWRAEHRRPRPDAYRNLLPLLEDGQFDLIVGDDLSVDYSELTINFAAEPSP